MLTLFIVSPLAAQMPDEEAVREATEKTRLALEQRLSGQIQSIRTTHIDKPDRDATYIRYTPANASEATNSGAGQRIIRMVNQQVRRRSKAERGAVGDSVGGFKNIV